MLEVVKNEPVLIVALVEALLTMALLFGAPLTKEQIAGIIVVVGLLLAIVARAMVTPMNKLPKPEKEGDA